MPIAVLPDADDGMLRFDRVQERATRRRLGTVMAHFQDIRPERLLLRHHVLLRNMFRVPCEQEGVLLVRDMKDCTPIVQVTVRVGFDRTDKFRTHTFDWQFHSGLCRFDGLPFPFDGLKEVFVGLGSVLHFWRVDVLDTIGIQDFVQSTDMIRIRMRRDQYLDVVDFLLFEVGDDRIALSFVPPSMMTSSPLGILI